MKRISSFMSRIASFRYRPVCLSEAGRAKLKAAAYRENGAWMFITRLEFVDYVLKLEAHEDFRNLKRANKSIILDLEKIIKLPGYFPDTLEITPSEDVRFIDKWSRPAAKHFINSNGVKEVLIGQENVTLEDGSNYSEGALEEAKFFISRIEIDESFERLSKSDKKFIYPLGIGYPNGIEHMLELNPQIHISWPSDSNAKNHKNEFKNRFNHVPEKTGIERTVNNLAAVRWSIWIFASLSLMSLIFWKSFPLKQVLIAAGSLFILLWLLERFLLRSEECPVGQCGCTDLSIEYANYKNYESTYLGVDETDSRYGDVHANKCKKCGQIWLRYTIEYESYTGSGRWYQGPISQKDLKRMTPSKAVDYLSNLDWCFAGGTYFGDIIRVMKSDTTSMLRLGP